MSTIQSPWPPVGLLVIKVATGALLGAGIGSVVSQYVKRYFDSDGIISQIFHSVLIIGCAVACAFATERLITVTLPLPISSAVGGLVGGFIAARDDTLTGQFGTPSFLTNMNQEASSSGEAWSYAGVSRYTDQIDLQFGRRVSNPSILLVGPSGTGKTTIVQALAYQIARGLLPEGSRLRNKTIYRISMNAFIGGARYVGDIQARIHKLLQFVKANPNAILFFDEFHTSVGAGATHGNDAGSMHNYLKEDLSAKLVIIGATTVDEYRRHIEGEVSYNRRFAKVYVHPPTREECFAMLRHTVDTQYRGLYPEIARVTDEAIYAAMYLTLNDGHHPSIASAAQFIDTVYSRKVLGLGQGVPPLQIDVDDIFFEYAEKKRQRDNNAGYQINRGALLEAVVRYRSQSLQ